MLILTPARELDSQPRSPSPWRVLARMLDGEIGSVTGAAAAAAALMGLAFGLAALAQAVIDRGVPSKEVRLLIGLAVGYFAFSLLRCAGDYLRYRTLARLGWRSEIKEGKRCIDSLLNQPLAHFDGRHPGESVAIIGDVSAVRAAISGPLLSVALDFVSFLVCSVILLAYEPALGTIVLSSAVLISLVLARTAALLRQRERESREALTALCSGLVEAVSHIRTIRIFGAERQTAERSLQTYNTAQAASYRAGVAATGASCLAAAVSGFALALTLGLGGFLAAEGLMTVGGIVFFFAVAGVVLGPIEHAGASIIAIQEALVGAERILDVCPESDGAADGQGRPGSPRAGLGPGELTLAGVAFRYGRDSEVISEISFRVAPGELIAVVGGSGGGKTTLAALLAGIRTPTRGCILLDGCNLGAEMVQDRRTVLAVLQDELTISGTIRENISFGCPGLQEAAIVAAAKSALAHEFIVSLPGGYGHHVGFGGRGLSRGQCQRIALARALSRNSVLLVLDEVTSALDPDTEMAVMANIASSRQGRTTVFTTHRLASAALADRILVLEGGRIREIGKHRELLLRDGIYARWWAATSRSDIAQLRPV